MPASGPQSLGCAPTGDQTDHFRLLLRLPITLFPLEIASACEVQQLSSVLEKEGVYPEGETKWGGHLAEVDL